MWDAIVIGSGIGGLAAAAALAKRGRSVLVLEQHSVAGGLTQTFRRQDWDFAPGVHYIGGVGPHPGQEGQFGRLLAWLTDGALQLHGLRQSLRHHPPARFRVRHRASGKRLPRRAAEPLPPATRSHRRLVRRVRGGTPQRVHPVRAAQHAGLDVLGPAPLARSAGRALGTSHGGRRTGEDRRPDAARGARCTMGRLRCAAGAGAARGACPGHRLLQRRLVLPGRRARRALRRRWCR